MTFDWSIFAEEVGKTFDRAQADIEQRELEKRAEASEIRMAKEKQKIALEGLNKQLEIEEPFKEKLDKRLLERTQTLAVEADQRQKGFIQWQEEFNRGLDIFSGSDGYQKAIEKAQKEGGLSQVAIMKMEDSIMQARAGKPVDIKDFEGLDPFNRMKVMDLLKQNNIRVEENQRKDAQDRKEMMQLQDLIQYRKDLAKSREEVSGKRGLDEFIKLKTFTEKSGKEYIKSYRELMNDLSEKVLDDKGRLKGMKGKNLPLINPETGEIDPIVKDALLKKYPHYRLRFQALEQQESNAKDSVEMLGQYTSGKPSKEINIPEDWIDAAMKQKGLTREQAIEAYKRFMGKK